MTLSRRTLTVSLLLVAALLAGAGSALLGMCGPFADVSDAAFCPFVLEIFYLGITTGTTPTTYDPASSVSRLQMAAFLSRTVDGTLKRGGRRAALNQFWPKETNAILTRTTVGFSPRLLVSDGADIWVANNVGTVSRVRASDGRLLETWTGATNAFGILSAMGRIFATGPDNPGRLYRIDPGQPAGEVTTVTSNLGLFPIGLTYDGSRIWTGNIGGSVSIVTPGSTIPWTVTTLAVPPQLYGMLYDGTNVWAASTAGALLKFDSAGALLQTVTVGGNPLFPTFDGTNIWAPNNTSTLVSVVRPSSGAILATLTGNGLNGPYSAAFDGQRILITNYGNTTGNSVSLWKAADLTPLGSFSTGPGPSPYVACSDGINFWLSFNDTDQIARF